MRDGPLSVERLRRLLARLSDLTATVDSALYTWTTVDMGFDRPTGEVGLAGQGSVGRGELIAFTADAHDAFVHRVAALPPGTYRVGDPLSDDLVERCALEAALLDLALRQRGASLGGLAGVGEAVPVGVCWSFGAVPSPVPPGRLKLDHTPGNVYDGLDLAVLDGKGGPVPLNLPESWIVEDPDRLVRPPFALDKSVLGPRDLTHPVLGTPTHVNLKAARMGGFLAALTTAIAARERGLEVYWGGQWEIGVARRQAQQVAALVCPNALNDLAPVVASYPLRDAWALSVPMHAHGFGPAV